MSSNPCNYMDYVGWRPLNGRSDCIRLVGHRSACRRRLSLYALRQLGVWHDQRLCRCGMRLESLYKCYMPLPLVNIPGSVAASDVRHIKSVHMLTNFVEMCTDVQWCRVRRKWWRSCESQCSAFARRTGALRLSVAAVSVLHHWDSSLLSFYYYYK